MAAFTTIDNPELYFQVKTYTGNGSTQAITLDGDEDMQPDWVWIKNRAATDSHRLTDSVRGVEKELYSNQTYTEDPNGGLTAFGSDGFSLNSNGSYNGNTVKYVAWCWKAGGSGSADTNGTINTTSTSANTTSLFSISTYTGNNSNAQTIGHGLGVAPKVYIQKRRDDASAWGMYHGSLGTNKYLQLESTNAVATDTGIWNNTASTSTVVSLGNSGYFNNVSSATYVSYTFGEVQGFSKFGTYTGNGSTSATGGPFIYTGFSPSFVIIKSSSASANWEMFDSKRIVAGYPAELHPHANAGESVPPGDRRLLFKSNGFKIDTTLTTPVNVDGDTYIYMAFAEAPFVNSNGVPCNAK